MGFNCLEPRAFSRRQFTFYHYFLPEIPGTHLNDLDGSKAESTLEPPSGLEHGTPGLGIQRFNH